MKFPCRLRRTRPRLSRHRTDAHDIKLEWADPIAYRIFNPIASTARRDSSPRIRDRTAAIAGTCATL